MGYFWSQIGDRLAIQQYIAHYPLLSSVFFTFQQTFFKFLCEKAFNFFTGSPWKTFLPPYLVAKNRLGYTRIGLTATKKVGHAVQRNRARRIMRAALSEHLSQNIGGYDIILVARARTPYLKSTQLSKTLAGLMRKAGLPDKAAAVPQQPAAKPQPNGAPE